MPKIMIAVVVTLTTFIGVGVISAANIHSSPPAPGWLEHLGVIAPEVVYTIKVMGWIIGALIALVSAMLGFGIRLVYKVAKTALYKLNMVYTVIMDCEGCQDSVVKYGRRQGDAITEEVEDLLP